MPSQVVPLLCHVFMSCLVSPCISLLMYRYVCDPYFGVLPGALLVFILSLKI